MIGERVKRLRKEKSITLSELAERANISKSYLSNIERNINQNPSIQIIKKIADVLNVDFHLLLEPSRTIVLEKEWLDFIEALKESGLKKQELDEMKTVIEFMKWKKEVEQKNGNTN